MRSATVIACVLLTSVSLLTAHRSDAGDAMSIEAVVKTLQTAQALDKDQALKNAIIAFLQAGTDAERKEKCDAVLQQAATFHAGNSGHTVDILKAAGFGADFMTMLMSQLGRPEERDLALNYLPCFKQDCYAAVTAALNREDAGVQQGAALVAERLAHANLGRWNRLEKSEPLALALIPRLGSKDAETVRAACSALRSFYTGQGGQQEVFLPVMKEVLTTTDPRLKRQLFSLIEIKKLGGGFGAELQAVLGDSSNGALFISAANAISGSAQTDLAMISPLAAALKNEKVGRQSRLAALDALQRIYSAQQKVKEGKPDLTGLVTDIAAVLGDGDVVVALQAGKVLGDMGAVALPVLAPLLDQGSPQAQRFALFTVSLIGTAAVTLSPAVEKLLNASDALVRRNAAEALAILKGAEAGRQLLVLLEDPDIRVSTVAADALKRQSSGDKACEAALAQYEAALAKRNVSQADPDDRGKYPADRYLAGGPLAGIELALFPAQHGETPGAPGTIPELAAKAEAEYEAQVAAGKAKPRDVVSAEFTPAGQSPQVQLYQGSVEHWRAYYMKYCPVRSFYDEQSQVKNWVAGHLPGPAPRTEPYEEPIYWTPRWGLPIATGFKRAAVLVQRYGKQDKPLQLDCGVLQTGAYTVRVIAAVPTSEIAWFRKPLVLRLQVNNGIGGAANEYALRCNYVDEFYSIAEFTFNTPEARAYTATLWLDPESEVELLVHNVSLDDNLAGVARRAIKTRMTMHAIRDTGLAVDPTSVKQKDRHLLAGERDVRDQWLWNCFPPMNAQQGSGEYRLPEEIVQAPGPRPEGSLQGPIGSWAGVLPFHNNRPGQPFRSTPEDPDVWMENAALGLTYTVADLNAGNPLPAPYPYPDRGYGLVWQDDKEPGKRGHVYAVIGNAVGEYYRWYPTGYQLACDTWAKTGNDDYAYDAAVALARWAYAFPGLSSSTVSLGNQLASAGSCGRASRFHKRDTNNSFYSWYTNYGTFEMDTYDRLYPFIENNWRLAHAIGRFVPWVKTPRDVIKLIDTHLVQLTAKRILRYNWHTGEMKIAKLASTLGDNSFTDPWMGWLFTATSVYPFPVAGLTDLMVSGCTREGTEYVASTAYARGENALPKATALVDYLKAGGDPKYDLSDPIRYPKPLATCYWLFDSNVAGLNFVRVGDVTGPDKFIGQGWKSLSEGACWGWKWSKDPYFAHAMVNYFSDNEKEFTPAEWAEIRKAADPIKRPLWLELKSRIMPQWASVLETGTEHDDYRFRRSIAIRTGMGWGHHHNDGLDLQVYAHGSMMTCDGGQRPGYSKPPDRITRMHNLVEVDRSNWLVHNWTNALSDGENAKYVRNTAIPPKGFEHVDLYVRQTALIDVDEGQGSEALDPARMGLNSAGLRADVKTANSYVFDVFRVSGGTTHTYSFHGNLSSQVTHNLEGATPFDALPDTDKDYVGGMAGERFAGNAPAHLVVDFHLDDGQIKRDLPKDTLGSYKSHVTRLHLLGQTGARVLRGSLHCTQWKYQIPMVFVQNKADDIDSGKPRLDLQTAFAAVIEPYVETPFISTVEGLTVAGNEDDARAAVALAVTTVNGNSDLCFADGRPEKSRSVGGATISGEFAYLSRDKDGLRQASLTGGTTLSAQDIRIAAATREYVGKLAAVDYRTKTMTLDTRWPAVKFSPEIIEVGTEDHWTAYNVRAFGTRDGKTTITVKGGADYYLSRVKEVNEASNTVVCALGFGSGTEGRPSPGIDKHWVASNEECTKWWRAEFMGGNIGLARFEFKLTGPQASMADFGKSKAFRLWEYGPADTVRHSTFVSLTRVEKNVYRLAADVDVQIGLQGKAISVSPDGKAWQTAKTEAVDGLVTASVPCSDLDNGRCYIKVE